MSTQEEIIEKDARYHLKTYRRLPIALKKGKGAWVWDENGKKYLDFLAGIAVNSLGHKHPGIVKRIKSQAEKLIHISNFYHHRSTADLAEKLVGLSGLSKAFFCNSGLEANEAAIKFARRYANSQGRNPEIVSFEGCFHGRSIASVSTGKEKMQKGFGPLPEGFSKLPFNDLTALIDKVRKDRPAAIILEVVQGEGGIYPADKDFIQGVRAITHEHDVLLICDEIQCGIGRTGRFFGYQHHDVLPDMVTCAKALGSGMPIGACLLNEKVAERIEPGDHGTTFGGNPMASSVADETVSVISEEGFLKEVREKGSYLRSELKELAEKSKGIKEVRGMGLMIGVELTGKGPEVVREMMQHGVLANNTGENVIRFVPPLIISKDEIDKMLKVFRKAVRKVL